MKKPTSSFAVDSDVSDAIFGLGGFAFDASALDFSLRLSLLARAGSFSSAAAMAAGLAVDRADRKLPLED
jgi:hypothetical protein